MSKMKRLKDVSVGIVIGGMLFSGVSYAASSTSIDVYFQPLKYFFDGIELKAPEDQQGFIYNGTTYVPLRFVSQSLGKEVGYDGPTYSIYVGKQKEGEITYLKDMKSLTTNDMASKWVDKFITNMGQTYINGVTINNKTDAYFEHEYILNGNFKKFEAILAPSETWTTLKHEDSIGELNIYADGKLVYSSGGVASDITKPIKVEANLTGAAKVKITLSSKQKSSNGTIATLGLGMLDAKFTN